VESQIGRWTLPADPAFPRPLPPPWHLVSMAVTQAPDAARRDVVIDAVRALSLLVVVMWHWVFTTITWRPDGPHASNPIGVTRGLWLLTWLLQVMPLFFFAGGYAHSLSWERSGGGWAWVRKRLLSLAAPASALIVAGLAGWQVARTVAPEAQWVTRGIVLVLSPLWFLAVYALLVVYMPLWRWLHDRMLEVAVVIMVGLAVVVDVMRFTYRWPGVELLNLVVVWAVAHQLGFFYPRLAAAPKRFAWCLALGGGFALFGLTNMKLYPRSMVGVPGEEISNMAPPTLAIAALTALQIGVLMLNRERIQGWACRGWGARVVGLASRNAMPIFLWHAPGFAVAYGLWRLAGLPGQDPRIDCRLVDVAAPLVGAPDRPDVHPGVNGREAHRPRAGPRGLQPHLIRRAAGRGAPGPPRGRRGPAPPTSPVGRPQPAGRSPRARGRPASVRTPSPP